MNCLEQNQLRNLNRLKAKQGSVKSVIDVDAPKFTGVLFASGDRFRVFLEKFRSKFAVIFHPHNIECRNRKYSNVTRFPKFAKNLVCATQKHVVLLCGFSSNVGRL